MGVLITWRELTGTRPTNVLLQQRLAPFALRPVLLGLARLSAHLMTWQQRQDQPGKLEIVPRMLPNFFPAIQHLVSTTPESWQLGTPSARDIAFCDHRRRP
jgi:hypothetical protein